MIEADDSNTKWLTHEEVMAGIAERRKARTYGVSGLC